MPKSLLMTKYRKIFFPKVAKAKNTIIIVTNNLVIIFNSHTHDTTAFQHLR